ncbi:MAG: phage holin family protein [Burkholderiales bacterium]
MASQPQRADEGRSPGLFESLRGLGSTLVAVLHTRVELLSTELERERARVVRVLLLAVVAVFFLGLGALTLTIFIVVLFWDSQRLVAIGFLTAVYLAIGLGVLMFAKRDMSRRSPLFSATRAQLTKDREYFTRD